jgi:hypothetical protein
MFKYKGKYYMAASNLYGWDASLVYYLVADDIRGPYLPANDMKVMDGAAEDYGHITQTGFFYTLRGTKQETVIYCGDRWADLAGNGLGYNQWVPLSFNGAEPHFNSLSSWNLDAATGKWDVAADNDYVRNGSFEADRKRIPSPVKPVQTALTGWETTIIGGNAVSQDTLTSPALNYANTLTDRKQVIGERSLNLSDKVPFKRVVSQTISSSPFVKLRDGRYTLKAKIRNSGGLSRLELFAESGAKMMQLPISGENATWKEIVLSDVQVKGGKVRIGFRAEGAPNAFCLVDDVSFVRAK